MAFYSEPEPSKAHHLTYTAPSLVGVGVGGERSAAKTAVGKLLRHIVKRNTVSIIFDDYKL